MGVASIDPVTSHSCVFAARIESPQLLRICTFGHLFGDVGDVEPWKPWPIESSMIYPVCELENGDFP